MPPLPLLISISALALWGLYNMGTLDRLRWFDPREFRGWGDSMDPELLRKLDRFRDELGWPVRISPAGGALGRTLGWDDTSQHNVDRWGEVRAVDVMPIPEDGRGMSRAEADFAIGVAKGVGFTGIGVYPGWEPYPGLHLDTREDRGPGNPALWGGVPDPVKGQRYIGQAVTLNNWNRHRSA